MIEKSTSYKVAVYWGADGYGGTQSFDTRQEAIDEAKKLASLKMGYSEVHVWKEAITPIAVVKRESEPAHE